MSFTKGCYVGQETVARLHYKGRPNRHLRGLLLSEPAEPGAAVTAGEREVGSIGSVCVSPARGPIALAVLRREVEPGPGGVRGRRRGDRHSLRPPLRIGFAPDTENVRLRGKW